MTANLFNKAVFMTDIHFGLRGHSREHNIDCSNFIDWMIDEAKKYGARTCFFLGDWNHHRSTQSVSTLQYSVWNFEKLSKHFDQVYVIAGNHDNAYRYKNELTGLYFTKLFPNVTLVNESIFSKGDVTILPWLHDEDFKKVRKIKTKYTFGHLEMGGYLVNSMVELPDGSGLSYNEFTDTEWVFSGHFHKRQYKKNQNGVHIQYMGNCFPHNFSDVDDKERGAMFITWGDEPEFKYWPGSPVFRTGTLSDMIDGRIEITNTTYLKLQTDIQLTVEDINYVKDIISLQYKPRELKLVPARGDEYQSEYLDGEVRFESVDQIVHSQIAAVDSNMFDKKLLLDIYNQLGS